MKWTTLKAKILETLVRWFSRHLWDLAMEAITLMAERDDLSGEEKFKLAREMVVAKLKEMGVEIRTSGVNWALESAVQYFKFKNPLV